MYIQQGPIFIYYNYACMYLYTYIYIYIRVTITTEQTLAMPGHTWTLQVSLKSKF